MSYTFRIRFILSPNNAIYSDNSEVIFSIPNQTATIAIRNPKRGQPLKDAEHIVLAGKGYATEQEATEAGRIFQTALKVALAKTRIGADYGEGQSKGHYTGHGLEVIQAEHGNTLLNDVHGLMIFQTELNPNFISASFLPVKEVNSSIVTNAIIDSIANLPILTSRELLAFSLFNGSFFQPTQNGRFLVLVMAIEALIEPAQRCAEVRDLVDELIKTTNAALIPQAERASLLGSLKWLYNESINQAGRRLVTSRLASRTYGNLPVAKFFSCCYERRSQLVHGMLPSSAYTDIPNLVDGLEHLVADLLTTSPPA